MKLYHFSYERVPRFELRVPRFRLDCEDAVTPRICAADSVEHCIDARPGKAGAIKVLQDNGLPVMGYVYEFEVDEADTVAPETLRLKHGVLDAEYTREHWLVRVPERVTEHPVMISEAVFDDHPEYPYPVLESAKLDYVENVPEFTIQDFTAYMCCKCLNGADIDMDTMVWDMRDQPKFFEIAHMFLTKGPL